MALQQEKTCHPFLLREADYRRDRTGHLRWSGYRANPAILRMFKRQFISIAIITPLLSTNHKQKSVLAMSCEQ
jgi:hypothetical protein